VELCRKPAKRATGSELCSMVACPSRRKRDSPPHRESTARTEPERC
jgi:hypothetical protein